MGDNLGPFGLSRGCKVIYSRVDAERIGFGALRRDALMAQPLSFGTRFRRQPRAR
jgi:hypothetical protein